VLSSSARTFEGLTLAVHIAIVTSPYDKLILSGRKKVEARLTRTALPPFGTIAPGDRIHIKRSSGPFVAVATAARVLTVDQLTPKLIDQLRRQYDKWICGADSYWQAKRDAQFATLVWLRDVRPCTDAPRYRPQNMRAWYTLDDAPAPPVARRAPQAICVTLTPGSLRQNYVRLGQAADQFAAHAGKTIALQLADGPTVRTEILRGMFRWRGWGAWFEAHQLAAGDTLQFTPQGNARFLVQPTRRS
jgi:hypothetical protein